MVNAIKLASCNFWHCEHVRFTLDEDQLSYLPDVNSGIIDNIQ